MVDPESFRQLPIRRQAAEIIQDITALRSNGRTLRHKCELIVQGIKDHKEYELKQPGRGSIPHAEKGEKLVKFLDELSSESPYIESLRRDIGDIAEFLVKEIETESIFHEGVIPALQDIIPDLLEEARRGYPDITHETDQNTAMFRNAQRLLTELCEAHTIPVPSKLRPPRQPGF